MTDQHTFSFEHRHIGPRRQDIDMMLQAVGADSMEQLLAETVPASIRLPSGLDIPDGTSEAAFLRDIQRLAAKNKLFKSYIGSGYYGTVTPPAIQRYMFEDPNWYTPYTPYQAEISQGRLEALLNFQTMVQELTGTELANASLLDEATAAAEAMTLMHRLQKKQKRSAFLVSEKCFPQTLSVLQTRAEPLGIEVVVGPVTAADCSDQYFGCLLQTPDRCGAGHDVTEIITAAHAQGMLAAVATDLLAAVMMKPAGEMDADIVVGNSQRFGVPLGYGGPHAAFFATREAYARHIPGRIIGVSRDKLGHTAYRMALQTREQHIRREKATSNICTAQALLAGMAGMYAVYHGPEGLRAIAQHVHSLTCRLNEHIRALGLTQQNEQFFDTLCIPVSDDLKAAVIRLAADQQINVGVHNDHLTVALDETCTENDVQTLADVFTLAAKQEKRPLPAEVQSSLADGLQRTSNFLTHPVFHSHRSELELMRYIKQLEQKDIGLDRSMIPLGSCTMKLSAAAEMMPVSNPAFAALHPFVPADQAEGYREIIDELCADLCTITGFAAVSLQPNAGSQGEFAGLMAIRAYQQARGETQRTIVLIPSSAHGTNPASAVMAGMQVKVIRCDEYGNIDLKDLAAQAEKYADTLSALMVTYPSTHGVFEESIRDICSSIHRHGGQVYMDGANLNAQVGITQPATIGADVCHLNLHKTFAIPHGGGGPGMGPIAVAEHLRPYLPGHPVFSTNGASEGYTIAAAPWGSASILLISYAYIKMLGGNGLTRCTEAAILNANYIKARLQQDFDILYTNEKGRVAHEMIVDLRPFKQAATEEDVAKRLMDFGFHAPTVSWPVPGTMMIEPTESESPDELDRFCDSLLQIRREIQEILDGPADPEDNVLKNAPHTQEEVCADEWTHSYSRTAAAFPLPWLKTNKYWPGCARVDNPFGDRNLICTCPSHQDYV